jgi:hypothetical protein
VNCRFSPFLAVLALTAMTSNSVPTTSAAPAPDSTQGDIVDAPDVPTGALPEDPAVEQQQTERDYLTALRRALVYKPSTDMPGRELAASITTLQTRER